MIHTDVVVTETCSVQLYTTNNIKLPPDDTILKELARAALPDSEWEFQEIVWDTKNSAVVWFTRDVY
jgi:hypothetical protein